MINNLSKYILTVALFFNYIAQASDLPTNQNGLQLALLYKNPFECRQHRQILFIAPNREAYRIFSYPQSLNPNFEQSSKRDALKLRFKNSTEDKDLTEHLELLPRELKNQVITCLYSQKDFETLLNLSKTSKSFNDLVSTLSANQENILCKYFISSVPDSTMLGKIEDGKLKNKFISILISTEHANIARVLYSNFFTAAGYPETYSEILIKNGYFNPNIQWHLLSRDNIVVLLKLQPTFQPLDKAIAHCNTSLFKNLKKVGCKITLQNFIHSFDFDCYGQCAKFLLNYFPLENSEENNFFDNSCLSTFYNIQPCELSAVSKILTLKNKQDNYIINSQVLSNSDLLSSLINLLQRQLDTMNSTMHIALNKNEKLFFDKDFLEAVDNFKDIFLYQDMLFATFRLLLSERKVFYNKEETLIRLNKWQDYGIKILPSLLKYNALVNADELCQKFRGMSKKLITIVEEAADQ